MQAKNFLDIVAMACALAVAVTVGRNNLKKQTIADLQALCQTLKLKVDELRAEIDQKDKRIEHLEDTVDGYAELVREGYLAGGHRQGGGNRSTSTQNSKNRSP